MKLTQELIDSTISYLEIEWQKEQRIKNNLQEQILRATGGKKMVMKIPKDFDINKYLKL